MTSSVWSGVNFACFLLAAVMFVQIYRREDSGFRTPMLMGLFNIVIAILGNYLQYSALSLHEMMSLSRVTTLGKNLSAFFGVIFMMRFIGYRINRYALTPILIGLTSMLLITLSPLHYDAFFYEFRMVESVLCPGSYIIILGKGIGSLIAVATVLLEFSTALFYTVRGYRESRRLGSKRRAELCLHFIVGHIVTIIVVVGVKLLAVNDDVVPLCTLFVFTWNYIAMRRYGLYDIARVAKDIVVETVAESVIVLDSEKHIVYANKTAAEILPRFTEEQLVQWVENRSDDEDGRQGILNIAGRTYRVMVQRMMDRDTALGQFVTLVDITEIVAQADQMTWLKDKAVQANRAKSMFLANMSHEIRTPMNAIVGITEIMLREKLEPHQMDYLGNIKNAGNSLLAIINDILDFSKVESGKMAIVEAQYEPLSLLNDMSIVLLSHIGEKPLKLQYVIDPRLPRTLVGDNVRVRQVLINLANNAVKFTETGHVRVIFRVLELSGDKCRLHVEVSDTGQGISPENLKKLFSDFGQVDQLRNRNKEGTGLGLSLSKKLVGLMGGIIDVRSEEGKGSDFWFEISQGVADSTPAAALNDAAKSVGAVARNRENVDLLRELCQEYGVAWVELDGLAEREEYPDFVFVDTHTYRDNMARCQEIAAQTQLVLVQNAMLENIRDDRAIVISEPLYSLNFCQVLNGESVRGNTVADDGFSFMAPTARILLVDDNEMNLKVASGLLKPLEMNIYTAKSGVEAIRMVEAMAPFDLIFMDHMMPGMDGCEATERIRQHDGEYFRTVPIVALTANVVTETRKIFEAAGMVDFVGKPIESNALGEVLRRWLPPEKIIHRTAEELKALAEKTAAASPPTDAAPTADNPAKTAPPEDELPNIAGIDAAEGLKNCGSKEMFKEMLADFVKMTDLKCEELEGYIETGDYERYTIEVHALKTVSRTIGATGLGNLFYELEMAGKAGDYQLIQDETPEALAEFRACKQRIIPFVQGAEPSKETMDKETVRELLAQLRRGLKDVDIDAVDGAMEKLERCALPDSWRRDIDRLAAYAADLETTGANTLIEKLLARL